MKRGQIIEFAELVGVSTRMVRYLRSRKILDDGDLDGWVRAYCGHLREQAAGRFSDGPLDLAQERAALARVQRLRAEQELQRAAGELVSVDDVTKTWVRVAYNVKSRMLAIPSRLVPSLAAVTEPAQVSALIEREVREALHELSDADASPPATWQVSDDGELQNDDSRG